MYSNCFLKEALRCYSSRNKSLNRKIILQTEKKLLKGVVRFFRKLTFENLLSNKYYMYFVSPLIIIALLM